MAASLLLPLNGAITFPSGVVGDFGSFELTREQGAESVCAYGANTDDAWRGSGTPHLSASVAGFTKGHAANTNPLAGMTDTDGAATTFTIDTGHTVAATCLVQSVRLMHARLRGAIPFTATLHQSGDATDTWASS